MKKITLISIIVFAASLLSAITEKQKNAFAEITAKPLGTPEQVDELCVTKASVIKPIADWCLENPVEAGKWLTADENNSTRNHWLLWSYFTNNVPAEGISEILDFNVFGGRKTFDAAMFDYTVYENLKKNNFKSGDALMSNDRIVRLHLKYGNIADAEIADDKLLVQYFNDYITAVIKNNRNIDDVEALNKYEAIEIRFQVYDIPSKDWKRLTSALDACALRIERKNNRN